MALDNQLTFDSLSAVFDYDRTLHYYFLCLCKETSQGNPFYDRGDVLVALGYTVKITSKYIKWYRHGKLHREDDLPAAEWLDGEKLWYRNGKLHREGDNPAVMRSNGTMEWRRDGELHRENDSPAIVSESASHWYVNGVKHRGDDKPAYVSASGCKEWYIDGKISRVGGKPTSQYPAFLIDATYFYENVVKSQMELIFRSSVQ